MTESFDVQSTISKIKLLLNDHGRIDIEKYDQSEVNELIAECNSACDKLNTMSKYFYEANVNLISSDGTAS